MRQRPNDKEAMVHGWCPSAWRPMMAGDGLLVRVRPPLARLTRAQALGLGEAALRHGNGAIDLTNRAALQIRGVGEGRLAPLLEELVALGLVAADPAAEARPAMLVAPDWTEGDATCRVARQLAARLDELPALPGKAGFAVDLSGAPLLSGAPADFRAERGADGAFLLRADGRDGGVAVAEDDIVDGLIALVRWFVDSDGARAGRMARHGAGLPPAFAGTARPALPRRLAAGDHPLGALAGVPFGRIEAERLSAALLSTGAPALRLTPWRSILFEHVRADGVEGFSADPGDALLHADACVGAPACPQATVETRALALRLAPHVSGSLHVSGCAKGCARPSPATVVLTGRAGHYDLGFDARAGQAPARSGLDPRQILALLKAS
ncbi:MAG: cobalamin biosynthesis protein CobG [Sphingobium sp.]